jgi:beta-phosphoglucomutase
LGVQTIGETEVKSDDAKYLEFEACIFDFDGVIIDSEPLHAEAKRVTLNHFRIPHPDNLFADFKGRPDSAFFRHVAAELANGRTTAQEMEACKQAAYLQLFDDVPLVPGAIEFLAMARTHFQKLGLATSATRHDFELGAHKYQLAKWFDAIVTGDDTARHKPDPEPYLKAMTALGVTSSASLVVEDSPNGIRAAKAAQCAVVALTTNFPAGELRNAGADWVMTSFTELIQVFSASL